MKSPFQGLAMYGVLAGLLLVLGSWLYPNHTTHAQCTADGATTPIDNGNDNITCTGGAGVDALGGDDTITSSGDFLLLGSIGGGDGNDVISASGNFSDVSGIGGGTGNDTISASGDFSGGSSITGGADNDSITSSGDFSSSSDIWGGDGNDTISNSGNFSGNSFITSENGNDTLTNSGNFSSGSAIIGEAGNDTLTLLPGSAFDATSWVDGDALNFVSGYNDLLILHSTTPIPIPNLAPCHALPNVAAMQANGCFVPWEGGTLYFVNFEQIQVILIEILEAQGISVDIPPSPRVICDDGRVKVFKLPNGDVEYYSGFELLPPNGFLVGKVTLAELAQGVRTFSDPHANGWYVVINQEGDALRGQVFDQNGTPMGNRCRH